MMESNEDTSNSSWRWLYKVAAVAALGEVLVALIEIGITFLPGGYAEAETVVDWFGLFQDNWFLGLRNLGLINMFITALGIPIFLALYGVHRHVKRTPAALAMITYFIGAAVFYATNRAFPMLEISRQYAAAAGDAQRAVLAAAGQALLAVGESHTPGTFLAFFFMEIAAMLMALVMLKGKVFSKATAYVGILGFGLLMIFEISSSFVTGLGNAALLLAIGGGLLSMAWYILIARRLLELVGGPREKP